MFKRRARSGQCFHRPCLGVREFPAHFTLVEGDMPVSNLSPEERDRDFGWMFHDFDFANGRTPQFFRASMTDGVIDVAAQAADLTA